MIALKENKITVSEYLRIREQVGWRPLLQDQAAQALDHSLYVVGAYDGEWLVGMGRIVGDGAVICYVQDLIVVPEYQKQKIGSMVLETLMAYVEHIRKNGSQMMLCLMCAKGRESFYEKHGFIARPTQELGPGMIQYLRDEKMERQE
ncbi:MAG: GNAT family N-acetyltransferase [Lachnospiraceae bacterium]|nr:GNAT family N-acetyltransferase [Lachnospiraceae bacterium]